MDVTLPAEHGGAPAEQLAAVGHYRTAEEGFDHGLVVLSMGLAYWLVPAEGGFRLLVEAGHADEVRRQIARYEAESRRWPPEEVPRGPALSLEGGLTAALLWAISEMAVYALQEREPGKLERAFALDPHAVFARHEWWRLVTALFLHASPEHLGGNLLGGLFVFSALGIALGLVRGWGLTALASVLGNLIAGAVHRTGAYVSLGASTGIFAALGVMTGWALRGCVSAARPWWNAAIPAGGGLAFLGLYGAGNAQPNGFTQTDVVAHAAGFVAGLLLGFAAAPGRSRPAQA